MDALILMIAAGCIAALLLHAAAAKLGDREAFAQHLAAYGVPDAAQPLLAWALPLGEGALALGLVTPWRALAAAGAAALLLLYGAAMAWHLSQGRVLDCGCGGDPLQQSWTLVARNVVLALLAAVAAQPVAPRPDAAALGAGDFAVAAAAVLLAALIYAAFNQLLRQNPAQHATRSRRSA